MLIKPHYIYFWALLFFVGFAGTVAVAQETPQSTDQDYFEALRLYDEGLYDRADDYFTWYISANPGSPFIESARYYQRLSRAQVDSINTDLYAEQFIEEFPRGRKAAELLQDLANRNFEAHNYEKALGYFRRVLDRSIDDELSAKNYYWMAQSSAELDSLDQALDYYLHIADAYPDSEWAPRGLYARGRLNLENERYDDAIEAIELLQERYPDDDIIRRIGTVLGESYYLQGRYEEAIDALRDELPYLDGHSEEKAIYLIAESHNYLNNLESASTFYRRYINMVEDEEDAMLAHYGLGWVFHKQEVYHWAAESFGKAADHEDIAREALYYKAINEKLAGRYRRALDVFEDFGNRFTEGEWVETAYYEWAITAMENNDYVLAIEVLQRLLQSDVDLDQTGRVLTLLGEAYFANGEYTRAEEAFAEAEERVDIDPDLQVQSRFQRAWVQYENGAYEQAQATFQEIHENVMDHELAGEALFWSADSHYNMGNYGQAADQFSEFLNRYPDHEFAGAAKYSLGWAFFKQNRFEDAVDPLLAFINEYDPPPVQMFPYDVDTHLRLGDALFATRQYQRAIEHYQQVTDEDRGGDYAMFQVANSYYRNNQTFEAVRNFRGLMQSYPESTLKEQAAYNIGYIYFLNGNYSQAIQEFEEVIERFPNSSWAVRAQHSIGDAYYNAGDFEDAVQAYQVILDEYKDSDYVIEAVSGIRFALESLGDEDRAAEILDDFLERDIRPETADQLRFRQAEVYFQSAEYEQAISAFRQYIRVTNVEERIPEAWYNIAESHHRLEEYDEALNAYSRVTDDFPDSERAETSMLSKAEIEYRRGNYSSSIGYYNDLVDRDGTLRLQALAGLGNAYFADGQYDNARDAFERGLEIDADHPGSRIGMGRTYLQDNEYDRAREVFREIADRDTGEYGAEAQYRLGEVFHQQGRYNEAIQAYARVAVLYEAHDEWVAWSMVGQAESYREQGSTGRFESTLENVLENFPDTEAAEQAQSYLQAG